MVRLTETMLEQHDMTVPLVMKRLPVLQRYAGSIRALDLVGGLIILIPALLITLDNLGESYDDAFITYRYAYNLATGNGFVYNVGERFLGTTAPLYGIILGVLGMSRPDAIPIISAALSGIALGLTGIALFVYGRLHHLGLGGWLAGLLYVLHPAVHLTFGGEMIFQVAVVAWAFVLYRSGRTISAAVLLAIAILTRPDGLVAAGVIGLHYMVTQRRVPWREGLCLLAVLAPWMLAAELFYGSLLPGTLSAKQAQRASGFWSPFLPMSFAWLRSFVVQGSSPAFSYIDALPHSIRFMYFTVIGVPAVVVLFRFWLLPLAWVGLFAVGYGLLDVPFYHWYAVPLVFGLMILAASGVAGLVELITRAIRRFVPASRRPATADVVGGSMLLALAPGLIAYVPWQPSLSLQTLVPVERLYVETAAWLRDNTPRDASIGYLEIGYLGYYSQRPIVDQLGLVNAGVAAQIAEGRWLWAYEHLRPDYVIYNRRFEHLGRVPAQPWFAQSYVEVGQLALEDADTLMIYRRRDIEP